MWLFFVFFSAIFDVLAERGSCVVIYMTYISLERKVFEIIFQLQTDVCLLNDSWRRDEGEQ